MAAPTIQDGVGTTSTGANPTVNLPSNIGVGDLLFILWAQDGTNNTINDPPSGWIDDHEANSTAVKVGFAYRVADGTEGSTVTYPSSAQSTCWYAFRIPAAEVDAASFFVALFNENDAVEQRGRYYQFSEGTSAAPDPPSLTLPYPATDILWVAAYGADNSLDDPSPYPSGYTGLHNEGGLAGAMLGVAYKTTSSNTEDPGAFAMSGSEQWVAVTIGLRSRAEGGAGGFPELRTATAVASAGTGTYTITLPESRQTGDRVIVQLVRAGTSGTDISWPGDWTEILDNTSSIRASVAYRDLDGSEADTFNVTANAIQAGYVLYLIPAGDFDPAVAPEVATPAAFSSSSTPDPPSLSPSWGAANTLWIIGYGNANGQSFNQVDFPSGWGIAQRFCRISASGLYGFASTARVENTATMDPGTLLISSAGTPVTKNGQAWTIAVKPGAGAVSVTPGTAALATATFAPKVQLPKLATPSTAALATSTFAPTVVVTANQRPEPSTAALTTTGFAPTVTATENQRVTPDAAALVLTAFAPTIAAPRLVTPDALALAITTFAPTVASPRLVVPGLAELATATFAPTVTATDHQRVTPDALALVLTAFAPTVLAPRLVVPPTAALVLSTFAPQVGQPKQVTPGTAALTISLLAPTVTATANQRVTPAASALTITRFAPTIAVSDHQRVEPAMTPLALSTFVPVVRASDHKVIIPLTLDLLLTAFAPIVTTAEPATPFAKGVRLASVRVPSNNVRARVPSTGSTVTVPRTRARVEV